MQSLFVGHSMDHPPPLLIFNCRLKNLYLSRFSLLCVMNYEIVKIRSFLLN